MKQSIAKSLRNPLKWLSRWRFRRRIKQRMTTYENFFEHITGGDVAVRISEFGGTFHMDPRSDTFKRLLIYKKYEPRLVSLIEEHLDLGKDALDIGANIGLFSVLMAKKLSLGGKVLAVEPTPAALHYLHNNISGNGLSESVIIYEGVASNMPAEFELDIIPGMEEYSSIGKIVHPDVAGKTTQQIKVQGETIDNLVGRWNLTPGFIKVDVEGAELQVLHGARGTIQNNRPVILAELNDVLLASFKTSSHSVVEFLEGYGYQVLDVRTSKKVTDAPFIGEIIALPN